MRQAEGDQVDADWAAKLDDHKARFEQAMNDDFNTPRAIATLFDLSRDTNTLLNSGAAVTQATLEAIDDLYQVLGGDALGIRFDAQAADSPAQADSDLVDGLVRMLIDMRQQARQARDWATADAIRDQLAAMSISLEDGPEGTRWRLDR
jgi:cysteinyl-tRNA synthetase